MGKITVEGNSEHEYMADVCQISLGINVTRDTAFEASKVSSEQCELLLSKLQELGFAVEKIHVDTDSIIKNRPYSKDSKTTYESRKTLQLDVRADFQIVNAVRNVIESGFDDATFSVEFALSNAAEINKQLLKEAISDSRNKAELLAETIGGSITGVDTASFVDHEDFYASEEETEWTEHERVTVRYKEYGAAPESLADRLKPGMIRLSTNVKIVWLLSE